MQLIRCLGSSDEVGLLVFEKKLQISEAIDGTKLKKLERSIGEIGTITAICYLLNRFNSSFNFGKSLSAQQSAILASDIVEKYPYETIEDVVLMLKMVRQGIIGDGKDYKLDGQNVMTKWFPEYLDKKYTEFEIIKQRELAEINKQGDENAVTKYYAKIRKQKAAKEKEENMRLEIDGMVKNMDRQILEDTIDSWSKLPDMLPYLDYLKQQRKKVK